MTREEPQAWADPQLEQLRAVMLARLTHVVDVEAGLRDILLGQEHTANYVDLIDVLDVEAGLYDVVAEAGANSKSAANRLQSARERKERQGVRWTRPRE